MKIIVGLGNPGKKYERTRHNIGWRVIDELARRAGVEFRAEKKMNAEIARIGSGDEMIVLCKPLVYMNLSGESARPLMDYYKLSAQDVIAVYDDKDILFGTVRLRSGGSAAGHNGVKSLIQHLGGEDFPRVRIGVADPQSPIADTADFVLARFNVEEEKLLPHIVTAAANACEEIARTGITTQTHKDIKLVESE